MNNTIPSEDDFARASAAVKKRSRGLSEVRERILGQFKTSGLLHEFFVLDCSDRKFRAYVFYPKDTEIAKADESGLEAEIESAVFDALALVGRGGRSVVEVIFETDSHENVERMFQGNYYNRLH